jgi:hypothetical protein
MTSPLPTELTPAEAADSILRELQCAGDGFERADLDSALDAYARALGLALQLGPAFTEQVLTAILDTARQLSHQRKAEALSALGPALVDLVAQVCEARALPATPAMQAWANVAYELGALIGQVGLALGLAPDHRDGMLDGARTRAALLDDATGNLFSLTPWIDSFRSGL